MLSQPPASDLRLAIRCLGVAAAVALAVWPDCALAEAKKNRAASKVYFADVSGEAVIDTGDALEDLTKRSVYSAQGAVIETKKAQTEGDRAKYYSTMVYSNGTGAFFDADTRVEVKQFAQEPFTPNRADVDVEPSVSQTQAFVARGAVGLCTSKLVAGSSMNYQTPHASVSIRGRKVVIEAHGNVTKVSMLEGESTIRGGTGDLNGYTVRPGEQAVIRRFAPGQPAQVQIHPIPPEEYSQLDDKVAMACMAKKTVYFEERVRKVENAEGAVETAVGEAPAKTEEAATGDGSTTTATGAVTAFDTNTSTTNKASAATVREIVPVEIVPPTLPTEYVVSPALLPRR